MEHVPDVSSNSSKTFHNHSHLSLVCIYFLPQKTWPQCVCMCCIANDEVIWAFSGVNLNLTDSVVDGLEIK